MQYRHPTDPRRVLDVGDEEGAKRRILESLGWMPVAQDQGAPPESHPPAEAGADAMNLHAAAPANLMPSQVGNASTTGRRGKSKAAN